jgi:hypothetical protein
MAPDVALSAVGKSLRSLRVLDPMCGSGTVLSTGVRHGHTMVGYDLDPLAVLMAKVATQSVDTAEVVRLGSACLVQARRSRATASKWSDDETRGFARYWFAEPQLRQLVRISRTINELDPGAETDVLKVCLSRLIVTKAPRASLAADTSHSRPHRVITTSDYDVYQGFAESITWVCDSLSARELIGTAVIKRGDARDSQLFKSNSVDLVVTSPPYLNAIDYLRGHRLALIWLGHSLAELRAIRTISIGSEATMSTTATEDHEDLVRRVVIGVTELGDRIHRLVTRYAHDMLELARNVNRCLVPGGKTVVVVADSVLRGRRIPTGDLVRTALEDKGLVIEGVQCREIPATLRYLPVSKAGAKLSKRMKHEYVITARKGGA